MDLEYFSCNSEKKRIFASLYFTFQSAKNHFISNFISGLVAISHSLGHFSAYTMGLFAGFWLSNTQKKC